MDRCEKDQCRVSRLLFRQENPIVCQDRLWTKKREADNMALLFFSSAERHRDYDKPLDPLTNLPLQDRTLVVDEALREEIAEFMCTGVPGPSCSA